MTLPPAAAGEVQQGGVHGHPGAISNGCASLRRHQLSLCTAIDCHRLPVLRDSDPNLAVIAVIFGPNDSVAPGK